MVNGNSEETVPTEPTPENGKKVNKESTETPETTETAKSPETNGENINKEKSKICKAIPIIISLGSLFISYVLFTYARQSNDRAQKLFVGQIKPLIDVSPNDITQVGDHQCNTRLSFSNYSGFDAKKIGIDVRYGPNTNAWIGEWRKAYNDVDEKNKNGIVIDKTYSTKPLLTIPELKSGETDAIDFNISDISFTGSLNLKEVCDEGPSGYPFYVRITWQNEKGHVFDEIHKYKLLCTSVDIGKEPNIRRGRSLTFIPEGVMSHKGKE